MAGLRDYTLALLISGGLAAPLQADLKIRVQKTFGRGGTTTLVYYCKGDFWRTESPGSREYMIVDWVNNRGYRVGLILQNLPLSWLTGTLQQHSGIGPKVERCEAGFEAVQGRSSKRQPQR